jgi:hypothetical protein
MLPFSFIGICCLQTAVVLTRPLFQAHEWKSIVTFKIDEHYYNNVENELETEKKELEQKTKKTKSVLENLAKEIKSDEDLTEYKKKKKEMDAEMKSDKDQILEKEQLWGEKRKLMVFKTEEAKGYLKTSTEQFPALEAPVAKVTIFPITNKVSVSDGVFPTSVSTTAAITNYSMGGGSTDNPIIPPSPASLTLSPPPPTYLSTSPMVSSLASSPPPMLSRPSPPPTYLSTSHQPTTATNNIAVNTTTTIRSAT